jgi:hypothetical protein
VKTGSISVFMWSERDTYFVRSLRSSFTGQPTSSKSKSKLLWDWQSVSMSVSTSWYWVPLCDLQPDIVSCRNVAVWNLRSCIYWAPSLTRGRVCNLQCNHSIVRAAQNPKPYFTVSSETPPTWKARFPYLYPPGTRFYSEAESFENMKINILHTWRLPCRPKHVVKDSENQRNKSTRRRKHNL